jgi:hypothetical protein
VRLEHAAHAESAGEREELVVLVRRVDQHGLAGGPAAQHEHVVVDGPDDEAVDLQVGVGVVQRVHAGHPRAVSAL